MRSRRRPRKGAGPGNSLLVIAGSPQSRRARGRSCQVGCCDWGEISWKGRETSRLRTPVLRSAVGDVAGRRSTDVVSVFVCYRREDSRHQAGRLYDRLVTHYGAGRVFKDVDSIPLGLDFREILTERVASCDVFLAVIGDDWLAVEGKGGARRLDDPGDFVRIEIEAALAREMPVIPVLVGETSVPAAEELPESLRAMAYRNGLAVRPDPDFHRDMDRLIRGIDDVMAALRKRPGTHGSKPAGAKERKAGRQDSPKASDESAPRGGSGHPRAEVGPSAPKTATFAAAKRSGWHHAILFLYILCVSMFFVCAVSLRDSAAVIGFLFGIALLLNVPPLVNPIGRRLGFLGSAIEAGAGTRRGDMRCHPVRFHPSMAVIAHYRRTAFSGVTGVDVRD